MRYSHVFLTRPQPESEELAGMLQPLGVRTIVQPAFDFEPIDAAVAQPELFRELEGAGRSPLLIFTSTRAVSFGLSQLPRDAISRLPVAAIGPSTADALESAGVRVSIQPASGFTSEALLQTLEEGHSEVNGKQPYAVIIAAPGGREKMEEGLAGLGWKVGKLMVYRRLSARLRREELDRLREAHGLLAVWTSANAIESLSQRLPSADWFTLCRGDWMVISERLVRRSRAYEPARIHLASGPANTALFSSIRVLLQKAGPD